MRAHKLKQNIGVKYKLIDILLNSANKQSVLTNLELF